MTDDPKPILGPSRAPEGETSTTSLLKKKRESQEQGEIVSTGPITSRLAEMSTTHKAKSKTGLYIAIGVSAVVVVVAVVLIFFTGGLSFIAGGKGLGAGTGEGGSAQSVGEGGQPAPEVKPVDPNAAKRPATPAELGYIPGAQAGGAPAVGLPAMPGTSAAMAPPGAPAPPPPAPTAPRPAATTTAPAAQPQPTATRTAATPPPPTSTAPAMTPRPAVAPGPTAPRPDAVAITTAAKTNRGDLVSNTDPEATKPTSLGAINAKKPAQAATARRSGSARVRYLVDENGTVVQTAVLMENPPGFGFGAAAAAAIQGAKFRPATKNGVPVKMWMMNEIKFQ